MMTPTLIDIKTYIRLSSSDTLLLDTARLQKDAKNYGQFLKMNKGTDNPPTDDEHCVSINVAL